MEVNTKMPIGTSLILVLVGAAIAFGLLKFVPFIRTISWILGIVGAVVLVGLALGAAGYSWLINAISGVEWLYALAVGMLGGSVLAGIFK